MSRLPGVDDRPLLRRPAHHLHLPAHRQLRRLARRRWSPTASTRARRSCARRSTARTRPGAERGWLDWLARLRHPGDHRRRHARARAPHPRRGRDARRRLPGRDAPRPRRASGSRPSRRWSAATWRARSRPREPTDRTATATARASSRIDTGIKGSIVRNLVARGARVELHPCTATADELLAARPRRDLPGQRPGRPRRARTTSSTRSASSSARGRCSASASATSCSAARSAWRPTSCPFGHRGANHPVKDLRDRPDRDHLAEPRLRGAGPGRRARVEADEPVRWETDFGAAELTHVNLYDRTVEGLALLDVPGAHASSTTPRRARARTTRSTCSTASSSEAVAMPRRDDLHKILILGSGPIVIGQAAEFDYSGVQACKVLREEGYEVVLVNSNPATIMTDPEFADATYVEPLLPGPVAPGHRARAPRRAAADARRPDGAEPRQGAARGRHARALRRRADRRRLRRDRPRRGPRAASAQTMDARRACGCRAARSPPRSTRRARALDDIGLPLIVRPAFTLGGRGGGIARTEEEFERDRRARPRGLADRPGADRRVGARLGRVRARGHARPRTTTS